jgi:hypothetical protein
MAMLATRFPLSLPRIGKLNATNSLTSEGRLPGALRRRPVLFWGQSGSPNDFTCANKRILTTMKLCPDNGSRTTD